MKRNIYLDTLPIPEALALLRDRLDREALVASVTVPTDACLGRVTSGPVYARVSSPTYHSAAMDGIAVRARDTFGAREGNPLTLKKGEDYVPVNTGNPLPEGFDAVIMIEQVAEAGPEALTIEAPAFPWQHVRRIGEDIVATELLIPRHTQLSPYDLGALLAAGIFETPVYDEVRLAIIPTGDEVLDYTTRPEPKAGEVIESNSVMLCAVARAAGYSARRVPPVPDRPEALEAAVAEALASDAQVVVIGAGSSAGAKDFTRATMERHGEVLVHGIAAMPGKPSLLGVAQNGKLMVGAPGYPVSAVVCFDRLVLPLCAWLSRRSMPERVTVPATLTRKIPSKLGLTEYVRLAVGPVGDAYVATPLSRGAGLITSLTRAQAVAAVPENTEGLEAGSRVTAELLVSRGELERTLVAIGSHDNTLDLLADMLQELPEPVRLSSTHAGSMGGITAVRDGTALLGGAHLLDPDTGDFNFPFLAKYAPEADIVAVNLAIRHQGLMVAPGNPRNIRGVADLAREDVAFINRQRGAGTRILLDYHLKAAGIATSRVKGYDKEEFTHMAVAVNVLTGTADCGLGIFAAARALGLDFVPLARERYDLLIRRENLADPKVAALLAVIRAPAFQARVRELGGYETPLTGREMAPGMGLGEG